MNVVEELQLTPSAPLPAAPVSREGFGGAEVAAPFDAAAKSKFIKLAVKSLLFVAALAFLKVPLTPIIVFIYFVFLLARRRINVVDLLAIWLVAVPFLGPHFTVHLGPIPDINFNRLYVVLLIFKARAENRGSSRLFSNGLDYGLLFFLAACLLSIPGSIMVRSPLRFFLDALLIPCAFYFVAKRCVGRPDFLPKLFVAAWLALLALGAMGVCEGLTGHDFLRFEAETTHSEGSDDFRVNGPLGTAERSGIVVSMLLLFVLTFKPLRDAGLVRPRHLRAAAFLAVGAVAFTLTRGVWLSLAAGWLAFQIRRRPALTLGLTGLVVVVWLLLSQSVLPQLFGDLWERRIAQQKTVYARIATYQSALAMYRDHPLLGIGFTTFGENWERFPEKYAFQYKGADSVGTPHNVFFAILSEMGLFGAVCFLVFQLQIFSQSWRLARYTIDPMYVHYAETAIAIAAAFAVAGMGLNFTYDTAFVNKIYFLVLGVLSGMLDQTAEIGRPIQNPVRF